mmetsp:Transcript_88815/g.246726  ORF Transcript_88815/g.246726 Transcript_88815/m.246726 type:complete len:472 (+) Transcript_88815:423-1838(+)
MSRRASWVLPPCKALVLKPSLHSLLQSSSANVLRLTKTSTLWRSLWSTSRTCVYNKICFFWSRSSHELWSKTTTSCTTSSRATGPPSSLLWLIVTRTGAARPLRIRPASACSGTGHLAEKKSVCLSGLMLPAMVLICSSKPQSIMRSASSNTKYVTRCRLISPVLRSSTSRPGVAATMWHPCLRDATWGPLVCAPLPNKGTTPMPLGLWLPALEPSTSFRASSEICIASSRTGASTRAMGVTACRNKGRWASMCTMAGSRYDRLLPLPGRAMPTRSCPPSARGSTCAWMGTGASMPVALSASSTYSGSTPWSSSKVTTGGNSQPVSPSTAISSSVRIFSSASRSTSESSSGASRKTLLNGSLLAGTPGVLTGLADWADSLRATPLPTFARQPALALTCGLLVSLARKAATACDLAGASTDWAASVTMMSTASGEPQSSSGYSCTMLNSIESPTLRSGGALLFHVIFTSLPS